MIRCGNKKVLGEHVHATADEVRTCFAIDGAPTPPESKQPVARVAADVPAGKYAIWVAGDLRFYQVDKPDKGRWVGWTFLSQLFGAPGDFTKEPIRSNSLKADILGRIFASPASESAALFGRKLGICGRCSSPLTTVRSRAAGYGEICAGHLGWPYPEEDEARVMLGEVVAEAVCP